MEDLHGEGTTTSVALEGMNACSTLRWTSFGMLCAKSLAASAVRMIAASVVRVLPKPISSARIPPPVSTGLSALSQPVIECLYLVLFSQSIQRRRTVLTYEVESEDFQRQYSSEIGPYSRCMMKSNASSWYLVQVSLKIHNHAASLTVVGAFGPWYPLLSSWGSELVSSS